MKFLKLGLALVCAVYGVALTLTATFAVSIGHSPVLIGAGSMLFLALINIVEVFIVNNESNTQRQ